MGRGPPRAVCRCGRPRRPCTPSASPQHWPACAAGASWGPRFGPRLQAEGSHSHPPGSPSWGHFPRRLGRT
eukprot:12424725-Heterocapsa_arctica.AAC.1